MAGSWGCPHEINGLCQKVNGLTCDPGMNLFSSVTQWAKERLVGGLVDKARPIRA
jgi:hypothetical protein